MTDKKTGIAVPLSALRTEKSPVIGEFDSLIKLADFAQAAGISIIQLLPVLDTGCQSSPYSSLSAFALHPNYITISDVDEFQTCYEKDDSFKKTYDDFIAHKKDRRFNYDYVTKTKEFLLNKIWRETIFAGCKRNAWKKENFFKFINQNKDWLPYYCIYKHIKSKNHQASWKSWPKEEQTVTKDQILSIWNDENLKTQTHFYAWLQYKAHEQFKKASDYVKSKNIILKGDLPILLNEDSCDLWSSPELFDTKLRAGSPPDGDNPCGQNWGFPCYDFTFQEKDDFAWWRRRISLASQYFDAYRLDHIPGFFRLWSIPQGESTAEMGYTQPYSPVTQAQLEKAGFSKERIRWLSQPHLPTEDFIRLIGDPLATREILGSLCDRIGREELWLFKPSIKCEQDLLNINLDKYNIDSSIQVEIFARLKNYWKNRTLIEISKNKYLRLWKYGSTKAWNSLSPEEKSALDQLFNKAAEKEEKLWQNQAEKIFTALTKESDMTACGEDLGVYIPCMEKVLDKFNILSLKVIRWCRKWELPKQPFADIRLYRPLSVVTTSVHDSSTLRQWYDSEIQCGADYPRLKPESFFDSEELNTADSSKEKDAKKELDSVKFSTSFDPKTAEEILKAFAKTSGLWFINPLQDWLYLDSKYYDSNSACERINIPGTVTDFNWTWRMGANLEKLLENKKLISKISAIAAIHDKI